MIKNRTAEETTADSFDEFQTEYSGLIVRLLIRGAKTAALAQGVMPASAGVATLKVFVEAIRSEVESGFKKETTFSCDHSWGPDHCPGDKMGHPRSLCTDLHEQFLISR
eukprot:6843946-Pyramimonas_sp.AAC.1